MSDNMDERKKTILRAITDDYISTAEPVGSRTIAKKYSLGVIPATIRNEMADLEDEGYLEQPHTSAGRVPSTKGYRFYVDSLMDREMISSAIEGHIMSQYRRKTDEIKSIIKATAKILADVSSYAAVVVGPAVKTSRIRHVQIVPIDKHNILVLIVSSSGFVEHKMISFENEMYVEDLDKISYILNRKLRGVALGSIGPKVLREINDELSNYVSFVEETTEMLISAFYGGDHERVYTDGIMNFLEQPEFREVDKVKPILNFLGKEELVLSTVGSGNGLSIKIGSENDAEELKDCSIISAPYRVNGYVIGTIGVVGPTRMNYSSAVSLVQFMADCLSDLLQNTGFNRLEE